jgi:hypothetical protein
MASRQAQLVRLRATQHPVLVQRILDDQLNGPLGTDQVGHDEGSAQPGNRLSDVSGSAIPEAAAETVRYWQCRGELKPAAQGESVDESESRYGRRPQLVENGVPNPVRWPVPGHGR